MKLAAESTLAFSREQVFRTYRDRLTELVPYLPNIRAIETKSRFEKGSVIELENLWHGGGDIPAMARSFLSESMLSWTDYASWDESNWTCRWRMEAHSLREALRAEGLNEFSATGDGCRMLIQGDLSIDGKKLPLPRFLAGTVGPAIEKFLVALITPNLTEVAKGVVRLLEAEKRAAGAGR